MSDYPMLISNKLHSFRNFVSANVHDNFGIFILHCLFLIIIYEESRLKKWDISGLKRKNIVFFVFFLLKVLQF